MNLQNYFHTSWRGSFPDDPEQDIPSLMCLQAEHFTGLDQQREALEQEMTLLRNNVDQIQAQLKRKLFLQDYLGKCIHKLNEIAKMFDSGGSDVGGVRVGRSGGGGVPNGGGGGLPPHLVVLGAESSNPPSNNNPPGSEILLSSGGPLYTSTGVGSVPTPQAAQPPPSSQQQQQQPSPLPSSALLSNLIAHAPGGGGYPSNEALHHVLRSRLPSINTFGQCNRLPGVGGGPPGGGGGGGVMDMSEFTNQDLAPLVRSAELAGLYPPPLPPPPPPPLALNVKTESSEDVLFVTKSGAKFTPADSAAFSAALAGSLADARQKQMGSNNAAIAAAAAAAFMCELCCKAFSSSASLSQHRSTHSSERPFSCEQCGRTFRHKAQLVTHERIHTGQRPYGCSLCGKRFRQQSHVIQHLKVHTGERPFVCDICGKAFRQKTALEKHVARQCKSRRSNTRLQDGQTLWYGLPTSTSSNSSGVVTREYQRVVSDATQPQIQSVQLSDAKHAGHMAVGRKRLSTKDSSVVGDGGGNGGRGGGWGMTGPDVADSEAGMDTMTISESIGDDDDEDEEDDDDDDLGVDDNTMNDVVPAENYALFDPRRARSTME